MEWSKYTIKTLTTAEDAVSGVLAELGIYGVEIEDNIPLSEEDKKAMFIDILPELPPDDGTAFVSFYLEQDEKEKATVENVRAELTRLSGFIDVGECQIISSTTRDEDWINNWKEFFKPFVVEDIVIKPTWETVSGELAPNAKITIDIDPGTSFGTGRHETTRLCIGQLKKYLKPGMRVLDAGVGSGILSIVAAKLGASELFGTDIDPNAVESAKENLGVNKVDAGLFNIECGNLIDDASLRKRAGSFDIVVANILADVIIPLSEVVPELLKEGGIFISSGIINTKEEEVRAAVSKHLEVIDVVHMNDWVSIIGRK